jgi:hypothetical protein
MSFGGQVPYSGERIGIANQLGGLATTEQGLGASDVSLGQTLTQPEITGNLPPGAQAQVDVNYTNALNAIKARYGNLGQTGSTMEADALSNLALNKSALQFSIAQAMASQGLQALQLGGGAYSAAGGALGSAGNIYGSLADQQLKEDHYLTDTIAKFAQALNVGAGRTGGVGNPLSGLSGLFGGGNTAPAPVTAGGQPLNLSPDQTAGLDQNAVDYAAQQNLSVAQT